MLKSSVILVILLSFYCLCAETKLKNQRKKHHHKEHHNKEHHHKEHHHKKHQHMSKDQIDCESIESLVWDEAVQGCYIVLNKTSETDNYSMYFIQYYTYGGNDSTLTTWFSRLRYNTTTGKVNTSDYTYSNSTGYEGKHGTYQLPYGRAMDCEYDSSDQGKGRIDLTGTPFAVNDTFSNSGFDSVGSAVFSSNNQIVDLTGGGFCGWTAPTSIVTNEILVFYGGWDLTLSIINQNNTQNTNKRSHQKSKKGKSNHKRFFSNKTHKKHQKKRHLHNN